MATADVATTSHGLALAGLEEITVPVWGRVGFAMAVTLV
jgi:hypothetical protein